MEAPTEVGSAGQKSCAARERATSVQILHRKPKQIIEPLAKVSGFEKSNNSLLKLR